MNEKEKAHLCAQEYHHKDNHNFVKYKILSELRTGQRSAVELNQLFHTGDSRKYVSILRSDGYPISDYWVKTEYSRHKIYFLK